MSKTADTQALLAQADRILELNDRGRYTVPTHGLYPFQWNWDSCLVALGQRHNDETRAWLELETLFEHQWDDGMVPHIVFHEPDDGYFPGPDVWNTGRSTPTTGITQPPVAGFALRRLYDSAQDNKKAKREASRLLPMVDRWHQWFFTHRDPEQTGLVALIHPWESGRDNSIDWDEPFEKVPTEGITPYVRRDTLHADPTHRPTKAQYDRYLWLVEHFRSLSWDNAQLHNASPFQIVDPGFNAILIRACDDLAHTATALGYEEIASRNREFAARGRAALETLWHDQNGQYACYDRVSKKLSDSASVGGLLPILAGLSAERASAITKRIQTLGEKVNYLVPSHDPDDERFDAKRYWRGPSWLIVNYLIVCGLRLSEEHQLADEIETQSLKLIETSGFAEYYDPITGEPCGGATFSWTAAMVKEFCLTPKIDKAS